MRSGANPASQAELASTSYKKRMRFHASSSIDIVYLLQITSAGRQVLT